MQRVLDHDGPEALVESQWTLLASYCVYAVPHPLVLRVNGKHLEAQVGVIDDGASSLNVQAVQDRLQRKQQNVSTQVGHEASDQLWEIGVQHVLDRLHADFGAFGLRVGAATAMQHIQH